MIFIPEIPDNGLKEKLEELVYIAKAAASSEVYEEELLTFEFNSPAKETEIINLEESLKVKLDEEYKDFLRFSNGAVLCFSSAEFYNVNKIKSLNVTVQALNFQ